MVPPPLSGHCKSLKPAWKAAAADLVPHGIKLANVDATKETALASRFSVQGYPTIKLFRGGKDSEYKGPRDAAGIVSYMVDQASPDARKVTALELEALLVALRDGAPEPQVVFFAAKDSDVEGTTGLLGTRSKLGDAYLSLAAKLRDSFSFAWTSDPAAAAQHGVKPGTLAVLHSRLLAGKLEPGVVPYSGSADADSMEAWLWPASLPVVGPLTQRSAPRYLKSGGLLVRVAVPNSWADDAKGANYLLNRLRRLAGKHAGLRLVSMEPDSPLAGLTEFGVGSGAAGALSVTAQSPEGAKYAMPGTWSPQAPEALQAWLSDLAAGKVETYVKSHPVPEGKEGGVTVVVGRTFDSVVLDDTKDVLIEFYAPWCGHCKTLAPKYEQLAQALEGVSTLTVAKLDATANDWSRRDVYEVKGFPTLYFKPAGKAPVSYDGEREAGAMAKWLAASATHKFEVPASLGGDAPAKKSKKKAAGKDAAEL